MPPEGYFEYVGGGPACGRAGEELASRLAGIIGGLPSVRTVCDLGCGNGYLCGRLLALDLEATGIDGSGSGVAIAAQRHPSGRFHVGRIEPGLADRLGRGRFDAVVSSDVIEHLYRPMDLLECAHGLLAPGGWLVLGTPYHGYLKNLAISLLGQWDRHHGVEWEGGHIKFFSVKTLSRMVEASGFQVERFAFAGRVWGLWRNMICIARRAS